MTAKQAVEQAKAGFFKSQHFNVVGASKDPTKYGAKVLEWYKARGFDVTPVHPKESSISGLATISDVSQIADPKNSSISVITPPKVSLNVIKSALIDSGVAGVWLQPGAEDEEVKKLVNSLDDDLKNRVVLGGPCILVEGDVLAHAQGKL